LTVAYARTRTLAKLFADSRIYVREARKEAQFHWWQSPTFLPVRWEGLLQLCRWGCKERRSPLPFGGWLSREQIVAGIIAQPEEAVW